MQLLPGIEKGGLSMERLSDRAIEIINELHTERLDYNSEYLPLIDAANKLGLYEDLGLEPSEVSVLCDMDRRAKMAEMLRTEEKYSLSIDRIKELVEADREGRIAILSEPMKPMVYKPNDTDVYCPNCGETLSGGWPLSDADDCRKMYQCFYCGQSIDTEKCEPYESDLKARDGN